MRISALTLHGDRGWPALELKSISPGLSCYYGPSGTGKSTVAQFLGHALYGKQVAPGSSPHAAGAVPEGELLVESNDGDFRLRRYQDGIASGRLTVASLDLSPVDQHTVAKLLGGISPALLSNLFAKSFDQPPTADEFLAADFVREFRALEGHTPETNRRTMELAARRDALAQELETRIAAGRRMSCDLDTQSRVLDRLIRDEQRETIALEQRLRAHEASLAETDARLRYRRLELNTELRWNAVESDEIEPELAELDEQIARWRTTLSELADRESAVRARLTQVRPADGARTAPGTNQRAWLAVARQLAADLEGEVARLARATASDQCVCRDSHPRLRPIVETAQRQLDVLESLVNQQDQSMRAAALEEEVDRLGRSQVELRRQLEHLLDRRAALTRAAQPRRHVAGAQRAVEFESGIPVRFSAADAEQLEQRRLELEQERFELVGRLQTRQRQLRDLRVQRTEVDRERAALLSARSIEHVQRELADVQRRLERTADRLSETTAGSRASDGLHRASEYFSQLTDGRFIEVHFVDDGRRIGAVNQAGVTLDESALTAGERDQLHISLSLSLACAAAQRGVQLPLVFDEPFARLDASGTAALAAVLDHFSRQGHQVLVFTGQRDAAERLASLGTPVRDLLSMRRRLPEPAPAAIEPELVRRTSSVRRKQETRNPPAIRKAKTRKDRASKSEQSDAA